MWFKLYSLIKAYWAPGYLSCNLLNPRKPNSEPMVRIKEPVGHVKGPWLVRVRGSVVWGLRFKV